MAASDRLHAVGPGWHPLLLRLHERLLAVGSDYRIEDLKEKLGEVRTHVTAPSATARSEMRGLITEAEKQSATICEFCGGARAPAGDASMPQ
ncbi:hypothetical protein ACFZBP_37105 [Streptomyces sp. NPDC008086]|uniref:hypothetical protein n=1 Tax=Streptomyces sp. NPDC008086 TaxID=3364807 RepID=UPI0036E349C1